MHQLLRWVRVTRSASFLARQSLWLELDGTICSVMQCHSASAVEVGICFREQHLHSTELSSQRLRKAQHFVSQGIHYSFFRLSSEPLLSTSFPSCPVVSCSVFYLSFICTFLHDGCFHAHGRLAPPGFLETRYLEGCVLRRPRSEHSGMVLLSLSSASRLMLVR